MITKNSVGFLCTTHTQTHTHTHTHTHTRKTALADVPWDIQVNLRPIITIILPGNSGSQMPSAAQPRLFALLQRQDPVSAAHTHHYKAAKLTKYKGAFARDEKFQLPLSDFFPLSLNWSCPGFLNADWTDSKPCDYSLHVTYQCSYHSF